MVCRSTPGNSALTTFARLRSGVDDVQVLSLFHELRSEGRSAGARTPSREEYVRFLREMRDRVLLGNEDMSSTRRNSIVDRLGTAEDQEIDGRTYYAWRTITERAVRARMAMDAHFQTIADRFGRSEENVRAAFDRLTADNRAAGRTAPQPPRHLNYDPSGLSQDRATRYALAILHHAGPLAGSHPELRDRAYEELRNPPVGESENCPNCGQFMGADHTCPNHFAAAEQMPAVPAPDSVSSEAVAAINGEHGYSGQNGGQDAEGHTGSEPLYTVSDGVRRDGEVYVCPDGTVHSTLEHAEHYLGLEQSPLHTGPSFAARTERTVRETLLAEEVAPPARCAECGEYATDGHACTTRQATIAEARAEIVTVDDGAGYETTDGQTWLSQINAVRHQRDIMPHVPMVRPLNLREARDRIRRIGSDSVTSDGRNFGDRQMAAIQHERTLPRNLTRSPEPSATADNDLERQYGQHVAWNPGHLQWETTDGETFSYRDNALMHEGELLRAAAGHSDEALRELRDRLTGNGQQTCEDCGRFMGADHSCAAVHGDTDVSGNRQSGVTVQQITDNQVLFDQLNETLLQQGIEPVSLSNVEQIAERAAQDRIEVTAASAAPIRERQRTALRTYRSAIDGNSVQMTNLSQVRADVRDAGVGSPVTIDNIVATVRSDDGVRRVTGSVAVVATSARSRRGRDRLEVRSAGERSLRCPCPDYRANYDCEHVRQAREEIQARLNDRGAVAVAPIEAVAEVRLALHADYQDSLAAQQQARADFTPQGASYVEDMAAFQAAWDEAKARIEAGDHRLPYLTEDVTGGLGARNGGRSFGIEIEVDFPDDMTFTAKERVAQEIFDAGLSEAPVVRGWHWSGRQADPRGRALGGGYSDAPNRWAVEFDRSVDDVQGQRGCEIVSPIMYDEPQTWENIAKVCEIVERNGGRATPRTGLHVNVGAGDYNHTVENHNRLLRMSQAYEDVIVRVSHNPQSSAQHRGRAYCGASRVPADGYRRISDAQAYNSHRAMVNLDHVPAEGQSVTNSTRVEVRIFDGTTDKGRLQTNIKVALGLVNAATRGVEPGIEPEPVGAHRSRNMGSNGRMRRLSGDNWTQDTSSFRRFADSIFSREVDKAQLVGAFAASRWQAQ